MTTPSKCPPQAALDAELEQIAALDGVIRSAQAEQFVRIEAARLLAAEVEGVTDDSSSADREFATRAFVAEIATALTAHEATAGGLVADAAKLTGGFTATLEALATGAICLGRARTLLDVASSLPAGSAGAFEAAALERAASETPSAFRRRIRRLRERLHPEPLTDRRQHARAERRVCFEPVEDGMAWLNLYLEAERGVAIIANLDAVAAAQQRAADAVDPRTGTQLKLDLAAGLLLGTAGGAIPGPLDSPLGVVSPRVYVTVPVLTLLGHSDAPAELDGYGPIDAETARRLAAHAPSFQRILTHPETGAYLSYGRDKYRVPADLAGYLRVRDGVCRFPGVFPRGGPLRYRSPRRLGGRRRDQPLQPRPPLPQASPAQAQDPMAHATAAGRRHPLDFTAGREYTTSPAHPFEPVRPPDPSDATEKYPVEPP
jgi:hypothetical protein